ncbi:MAG: hypothetical protein ACRYFU_14340 [Janthinobacterium lividum]
MFRIGERIPLELSFTSSSVNRYEINLASYDRSGRLHSEQFNVNPTTGWKDPLAAYFANGYAGGGISSSVALSSTPQVIDLNLNEWVRFDQPGDYDVSVRSSRVSVPGKPGAVELRSNALKLHIVPATPEWQALRLNAALATLRTVPASQGLSPKARTAAISDIRYLHSKQAIQVMAAGMRDDQQDALYAYAFGLIGLPKTLRDEAAQALQVEIDDPLFPISGWFLTVETQILSPESTQDREDADRFRELAWRNCLASLSRKNGKALAVTAETLLNQPPTKLDAQERAQLALALSKAFLDLSPEQQTGALMSHWDVLRSDTMEPALRKLAEQPLEDPANNLTNIYVIRELKAVALSRWYDLNPDGATREALRQVGSASPSLTEKDLIFLGDRKMPQFEAIWAAALLSESSYTRETALAGLLARYGTGAGLSSVVEKASNKVGRWECAPQGAALAYVVEFDPEQAKGLLQRAVAARGTGSTACNRSVFQDVAMYTSDPVITDVAITAVNDPDPQVAMDALIYLMYYGDKRAKEPIWNRYLQWTEEWSNKSADLEARMPGDMAGNWEQRGLGENLATALIANQGWLADKELIAQVLSRCVGEQMCTKLRQLTASADQPYHVRLYRQGRTENHTIAQYSEKSEALLQVKLTQFPSGTTFILDPDPFPADGQIAFEEHSKMLFKKAGMSLIVEHK